MSSVAAVFTQNILPIFIVAGFGFALQRWVGLDKRTLSRAVFYCLSPCLVFSSLVNSQLPGDELLDLAGYTVATVAAMGALLAACNTVEGVGKDVKGAGQAIENAAN